MFSFSKGSSDRCLALLYVPMRQDRAVRLSTHIRKHQTITIAGYVCQSHNVTYLLSYQP